MTTITWEFCTHEMEVKITAEGHTGQAERGKDIVCASVSTAMHLLAMLVQAEPGARVYREDGFEQVVAPAGVTAMGICTVFGAFFEQLAKEYDGVQLVRTEH